MAKRKINPKQLNLFGDWLVSKQAPSNPRYVLAQRLADKLNKDGEVTSRYLTSEANHVFGGIQAEGKYSSKDSYDALEAAFNLHLRNTETGDWNNKDYHWAMQKADELTKRIRSLPTQTRRDEEMDEFQQFSTPPALSFVANWVANIKTNDIYLEPHAGTGDLAIWPEIAGVEIILNELSPRRQNILSSLFPKSILFKENAEQLDNVLPADLSPSVIVMNPPFSSTAGRVQGQRDSFNGARHIEQGLRRLQTNGRLVTISGQAMSDSRPDFREWWKDIKAKYNVRANVSISGREYSKYGTTYDNQIIVIDKNGPTLEPVLTGYVETVADLPKILEGIKNERPNIEPIINKPTVNGDSKGKQGSVRSTIGISRPDSDKPVVTTEPVGDRRDRGASTISSEATGRPTIGNVVDDGIGTGGGVSDRTFSISGRSGGTDLGGDSSVDEGKTATLVSVEYVSDVKPEFTESVFANYTPQRLKIPGAKSHPGKLVQSAAMAAVEPPPPTYKPALPSNIIDDGLLSLAQLETIVYAGQAHEQLLSSGSRKGYFIGDGTGVGKGREISGIILDNMSQGRKKAVWVSYNEGLIEDAKRDFSGIGGDPNKIFFQGKTKAGAEISQKEGILFTTYSTLRGGERRQANDQGQKIGKTRVQQLIDWLGDDFDGVVAFDEAHSMANAIAIKGKRGISKPSQQALAGINLQHELPNARVLYVSATGATEITNLRYADRLGLWGEGTAFADVNSFIRDVSKGGISSMELVSRDMKAMGMYISRSLSFDGVTYERLEHQLSDLQRDIYNELAGAWQVVLNNVEEALAITQAGSNGHAKSAALSQFWGAHQRFFNQIITAMQTPTVIDDIRRQLDNGNAAVVQLVNTNEATQERIVAEAIANNTALEDLDFTPRQMLVDYVRNGFPVAAFESTKDYNGNTVYVPVLDSDGNPVLDREAILLRDNLLETLHEIRVPENPLDSIINAFGPERVAEVTGRGRRFVQLRDDDGNIKIVEQKRGKSTSLADAESFQDNKKDILIFSEAGGTGYSFHADNTCANQRKRIHYILQPGWQASKAVQGFGRTHRTNEASEPHYVLPTTNLKAQKRFVSSIARRLDQLGALTRGQRDASSQGLFTASDNLESYHATVALHNFFRDLYLEKTPLSFLDVSTQMGLNLFDENGSFSESKIPNIPQFLNRLLSLKTDMQNEVFNEFEDRLIEAVEYSKQHGLYDEGLQTLKALSIKKTRDDIVFEDKNTAAQTRYVELDVTNDIKYKSWEDIQQFAESNSKPGNLSGFFVSEYGSNKGDVFYLRDIGERLDSEGATVRRGAIYPIRDGDHKYIDNTDEISKGDGFRNVSGKYQRVTLSRNIGIKEAEVIWNEQIEGSPKTYTKKERMIVGAILPIWDRVEGSETIKRCQTDDGEQLLGRMLGPKAAKNTLKNLGTDSGLSKLSSNDLFNSVKNGGKAILSNGWEISLSKVNYEDRIEVKGRIGLTNAEKNLLKEQGAFIERISWSERAFIPTGDNGPAIFERIIASKPVVDLIGKDQKTASGQDDISFGVPEQATTSFQEISQPMASNPGGKSIKTSLKEGSSMAMNKQRKPLHEEVTERLIEQLKQGTAPWQKPWKPGKINSYTPYNPTTGKRYRGFNVIQLLSQDMPDQRWMTYKQAQAAGAQVRKGEKGTPIQYWKFTEEVTAKDEDGNPVFDDNGNEKKIVAPLERPRVFYATVFNALQIDGLPPPEKRQKEAWDTNERADAILKASGASIVHGMEDRAFYRSGADKIYLPGKEQFDTADNYFAIALHELAHWTGHPNRLNRDLMHPFGSEAYAREELRAEIGSMILGDQLGIGHDPGQHAAYVKSWIKVLEEDPLEIFRASAEAEKIHDFIMAFENKKVQDVKQDLPEPVLQKNEQSPTFQEADMSPFAQYIDNLENKNAYQTELAYLLRVSTLTPGRYTPTDEFKDSNHAAVFVDDRPAILCGPSDDPDSVTMADALAKSGFVKKVYEASGNLGEIHSGVIVARNIPFNENESAIVSKSSGQVELGGDMGPLVAVILDDPANAISTSLCVTTETARIFDPNAPELDNGQNLSLKSSESRQAGRKYINVDFKEKEEAKGLGAKWDRTEKSWYIPPGVDQSNFTKWTEDQSKSEHFFEIVDPRYDSSVVAKTPTEAISKAEQIGCGLILSHNPDGNIERIKKFDDVWQREDGSVFIHRQKNADPLAERQYLAVQYGERNAAKAAGAKWDSEAKSWYVGPNADMRKIGRWLPENVKDQQSPSMSPSDEFTEALKGLDCIVDGPHPIMDGQTHRIKTEGDKQGERSGFYVGYLDGHPAGYIKNNRTGVDMRWKSKGYSLSEEEKSNLSAIAEKKLAARAAELAKSHENTSKRVTDQLSTLVPVAEQTAYMKNKGIQPQNGVFTDGGYKSTFIPAYDVDGKLWSMQYVQDNGTKRFAKNSKKEGCFHPIGGMDALTKAPVIIIAEGYGTAATLSEAVGYSTVAAFDSGNVPVVAKALREKFPDKPIIIAGEDDLKVQADHGVNPGRKKATEAAQAVGGTAIFPIFAPGEQSATSKDFTDFNDLANSSVFGMDGVKRQVLPVVKAAIENAERQKAIANQEQIDLSGEIKESLGDALKQKEKEVNGKRKTNLPPRTRAPEKARAARGR